MARQNSMPNNVVTLSGRELKTVSQRVRLQRPGFNGYEILEHLQGWTTVRFPNWEGSRQELFSAVRP